MAWRNFDDRLSAGGGHRGDETRRLTLPRNDIGHRLHVDVFPVRSGFIDMLICNLLGHEGVRSVADLLLNFRMPWVPHGLILGLACFPFDPLILIAVIVRPLR